MPTSQLAESSVPVPVPLLAPTVAGGAEARPRRHAHYVAWHLDPGHHGSAPDAQSTRTRDQRVTWNADRSGEIVVTTPDGEPRHTSYGAGELTVVFPETPPAAPLAMGAYLSAGASVDDATDPVQLVDAVAELLNEWTLPARHQAAIVLLLARMAGITATGAAVDPLGRPGTAYLADSPTDDRFAAVLTVSEDGTRILSVETVYRGGIRELELATPVVARAIAWR
jgi:hypothetical protein